MPQRAAAKKTLSTRRLPLTFSSYSCSCVCMLESERRRSLMEAFTLGSEVLVGVILVLISYLYWRLSRGPGASLPFAAKVPPVQGGWLPWVGCALDFGKEPLWFIKKTHDKVSDLRHICQAGVWNFSPSHLEPHPLSCCTAWWYFHHQCCWEMDEICDGSRNISSLLLLRLRGLPGSSAAHLPKSRYAFVDPNWNCTYRVTAWMWDIAIHGLVNFVDASGGPIKLNNQVFKPKFL